MAHGKPRRWSEGIDLREMRPTRKKVTNMNPVTADNFTRAETDTYLADALSHSDGLASFYHYREPMPIDNQTVVRTNRDTLYSSAVVDLEPGPVTVTLPDPGTRFMSLIIITEDHYATTVYAPGTYSISKEDTGTRYALLGVRTFVDPSDPDDLPHVHALQDAATMTQPGGPGTFTVPSWDPASQKTVRDALLILNTTLPDMRHAFGRKEDVDPVRHLIATAAAWGGNPDQDAQYLNITPAKNDGSTEYRLTVPAEVPVDGFWSITVYGADGYIPANDLGVYSLNSLTAEPNADGTVSMQFGGCDNGTSNCIPVPPNWNYMVRLYRPREEILDGTWIFPEAQPVG
ncbi:MAG: DUF1214 domain-containing protein [Chloroflexota bacterium]|nr:DUF1214 domain-containing protein [Chloroflexota bacterium]